MERKKQNHFSLLKITRLFAYILNSGSPSCILEVLADSYETLTIIERDKENK